MTRKPWKRNSTPLKKTSKLKQGGQLKRGKGLRVKPKSQQQIQEEKAEQEKMWKMFLEIWDERPHRSEVSGQPIYGECKTVYMHHIWSKSTHEELKYVKENIIIMTWEEHANVEADIYKYEEVNRRRELLREKYNL